VNQSIARGLAVAALCFAPILNVAADDVAPAAKPPVAKKVSKTTVVNGVTMVDNYYWMREKSNPEVKAYLEAENVYTDAVMKPTEALQRKLYGEMLSRIKETDTEVPYKDGAYFYYSRTEAGKQYSIFCRKKGSLKAREEVILDVNELAKGQKFMSLGGFAPSEDGNLLAYVTDNTGFRQYTLAVKDLRTGKLLPDHAERVDAFVWSRDGKTMFYVMEDAVAKRPYRLYRHAVGTAGPDTLAYEEADERFDLDVAKTRSQEYFFLLSVSHTTSEARYLRADEAMGEWKLIEPRKQGVEYYPDHHGDSFYIRVNDTGRNFRLVKAPVSSPGRGNWKEVVPDRKDVMLEDVNFFQNFYVLSERENGLPQLRVTDFRTETSQKIPFPEPAYSTYPQNNREYEAAAFRYGYQSFITPPSVYDYDVATGKSTLLKQHEVLGGYDRNTYEVEQVYATAMDGVKVPISLVHLRGQKMDGKGGLYLSAYGSYGIPNDIYFDSDLFSLVNRGVVCAVAHIRGGGELGKAWHDDGRMMHKRNTFTDFIASAEYLVAQGYGAKDRLVIEGASAGGLLMGAVLNLRPDLFHAALVEVPFVDVMNTMLDETLPLTVGEFEEWGNPKEKAAFDYMMTYSPYDNVTAKEYPNMLVRTSFNDSQVMYWEPTKYVAKMRALRTDHNTLIFKVNLDPAGHGGVSGRYNRLKDEAFNYAYILTQMGITS
jgi:oligopeptidase B